MINWLIPSKLKLYLLIAGMILAAFFGVYWQGGHNAAVRIEAKNNKRRLNNIRKKQEIERDVENMSDDDLVSGILHRW